MGEDHVTPSTVAAEGDPRRCEATCGTGSTRCHYVGLHPGEHVGYSDVTGEIEWSDADNAKVAEAAVLDSLGILRGVDQEEAQNVQDEAAQTPAPDGADLCTERNGRYPHHACTREQGHPGRHRGVWGTSYVHWGPFEPCTAKLDDMPCGLLLGHGGDHVVICGAPDPDGNTCALPGGHGGQHMSVNDQGHLACAWSTSPCQSAITGLPGFGDFSCTLPAGHAGRHQDPSHGMWRYGGLEREIPDEGSRCESRPEMLSWALPDTRCTLAAGHRGYHRGEEGVTWGVGAPRLAAADDPFAPSMHPLPSPLPPWLSPMSSLPPNPFDLTGSSPLLVPRPEGPRMRILPLPPAGFPPLPRFALVVDREPWANVEATRARWETVSALMGACALILESRSIDIPDLED